MENFHWPEIKSLFVTHADLKFKFKLPTNKFRVQKNMMILIESRLLKYFELYFRKFLCGNVILYKMDTYI